MSEVIWLHDDALRQWYGESPAVYVFDEAKLIREQWSLKRVGFIYECLLELPVEIRRGDPVSQVLNFQRENRAQTIRVMDTADTTLREQINRLRSEASVEIEIPEPFVHLTGKLDLRRFSRYWTKAERALLAEHSQID